MANLRVIRLSVLSSTKIKIKFTHNLDQNIGIENIQIGGAQAGVSDLEVLSVEISSNDFIINVRPMISRAYYQAVLKSTITQPLKGLHGERLLEDGATNIIFFIGQTEENAVREEIFNNITDVYNKESGSLVHDSIDVGAREILKSAYALGEAGNSNYISIQATDENLTRGFGPYDRFSKESVFQILRVGANATGAS